MSEYIEKIKAMQAASGTKNFDTGKREIERIFNFIYAELVHDESLSEKEFRETLRTNLDRALDTYESMKPYALYNRMVLDVYGMEFTWNGIWVESSEIWLGCNPDGYTEDETDQRIDAAYLNAIEWSGLDTQVHYHDLKSGKR